MLISYHFGTVLFIKYFLIHSAKDPRQNPSCVLTYTQLMIGLVLQLELLNHITQ